MKDEPNYIPINCDFHNHIEIFAQRKNWVQIEYVSDNEPIIEVTKIVTTLTRDKIEYVLLVDDREIRMDALKHITLLNPAIDMRVNLLEKLKYNEWCNQKIVSHLKTLEKTPEEVVKKMCHIINAHDTWNRRILQLNHRFQIWEEYPRDEWPKLLRQVNQESKKILLQSQLDRVVNYYNTKEEPHQSTIADIVYHIINHGTYHRGQISDILTREGMTAIPTDYILFSRNKA